MVSRQCIRVERLTALARGALATGLVSAIAISAPAVAAANAPGQGTLPENRAWEMVSPTDKNGVDVLPGDSYVQAAARGNGAAFGSYGGFAGAEALQSATFYVASRGGDGWRTRPIMPRQTTIDDTTGSNLMAYSADLSRTVLAATLPTLTPEAPSGIRNLYMRDDATGSYALVGSGNGASFADASDDFGHVLFESAKALTPDAPIDVDPGKSPPDAVNLYETVGGATRLVGVLPNGQPAPGGALAGDAYRSDNAAVGIAGATFQSNTERTMSDDGSRIFWTAIDTRQLYVRVNGTTTVHVSASQRTDCAGDPSCGGDGEPDPAPDPAGPQAAQFQIATPDGGTVYFLSSEQLTDDSVAVSGPGGSSDLYAFDLATGTLTDLTANDGAVPAGALGVLGVSDDGASVYFSATGVLAPGADVVGTDPFGNARPKLYLWRRGEPLRYVGTVPHSAAEDASVDRNWRFNTYVQAGGAKSSEVSPDGRFLLVRSGLPLDREDDPAAYQLQPAQMYLYDAASDDVVCVSCRPDGSAPTGDAYLTETANFGWAGAPAVPHALLPGGRVVFTTPDPLVSGDDNGRRDVYLWTDGAAHLLTSGHSPSDSFFGSASADGDDIFIVTRERLSRWDVDANLDLYDARVGGGLPEPPVRVEPCSGDACQGESNPPDTAFDVPGSGQFDGAGDLPDPARRGAATPRKPAIAGPKTIVGARGSLRVSVAGRGTLRGRGPGLRRSRRSVSRAGRYALSLALTARARGTLVRRGRFATRVRITFTARNGRSSATTVRVTFRANANRKGR